MKYHCLFEQSGTFKNEFKKIGYKSYDYDILNEFNETDYVIDLFEEIEKGYLGLNSIFDQMVAGEDFLIAFFPCTRFEDQIQMAFRGTQYQLKNWGLEKKLQYDLKLHKELSQLYELITKLAIICIKKNLPLIIENPYSTTHYLTKYWAIPYTILDLDRTKNGDYYKKPTQYWFINCEPQNNIVFEAYKINDKKTIENESNKTQRSMISSEYASRFIKQYILKKER